MPYFPEPKRDDWSTPTWLVKELDGIFNFTLDPCATSKNAVCKNFFTVKEDGLKQPWSGTVFMNPPYGRGLYLWVKKAYDESRRGVRVIALLPARTDTGWFHDFALKGFIWFIRSRLVFGKGTIKERAPFPSMLLIFGIGEEEALSQWISMPRGVKRGRTIEGGESEGGSKEA